MTQIDNKFKVKKGLEVIGDSSLQGNVDVTGNLTVPTQTSTDNSTNAASTAFVKTAVANLVDASPGALDTLNELAAALGDDPNFATTVTNSLNLKAPLASPALTGTPTAPTPGTADNSTTVATTAFVKAQLNNAGLTGVPVAPTAPVDTSTTQLATTAFVANQAANVLPLMNSVAAIGTSKRYARQDHVHASDTTKANLAGAAFTGALTTTSFLSIIQPTATEGAFTIQSGARYGRMYFRDTDDNLGFYVSDGTTGSTRIRVKGITGNINLAESGSGNVLIGTGNDATGDKLQVAGNVSATTFKGGAALTGTPTAPTAAPGTNNTQLATTAYADAIATLKVNATNPAFAGNATFAGAIASGDYSMIPLPNGARYSTASSSITGAFKITLPVLYLDSMISFTVRVYEYVTGKTFEMVIAGYLDFAGSTWRNTTAFVTGEAVGKIPNVRFGNDGTKACVWIGDVGTTWSYPQVSVRDFHVGFANQISAWLGAWSVAPVIALDTVKIGPIVPTKFAGLDSPALTGVPTAPTAAPANNSTQVATTAYVDAAGASKANLASPALTGVPTVPTAAPGTSTTQAASTAFVGTAVANLIASSPAALDTLNELAAALGNDPAFATTITNAVSMKAPLANPALTGVPTAPTAAVDTNTTQLATTQFVLNQGYVKTTGNGLAPLASPVFTGDPTAPTPTLGDSDNSIATTGFVNITANSALAKSVAGGVTVNLTAVESKNRVILLTGLLTANISVILPTMTGIWAFANVTTGAYTVTVKLASGVGVTIPQNSNDIVFSDGTGVFSAKTNFTDVYLNGIPTTTTAATADSSTRVATTAFVKAQSYLASNGVVDGGSY